MNAITDYIDTAYHESGHAIAAAELGIVVFADVTHTAEHLGICQFQRVTNPTHRVAIALAGPLAAWEARRRDGEMLGAAASADLRSIDKLLAKVHGVTVTAENRTAFPEWTVGRKLAWDVIGKNWGAIIHVANWLREHKRASGHLIHACLACNKLPEIGE